ncbi:hypothetical protein [Dactylosporangium sp. CA-139066]|uniref:hypothetical protein n=1 Tax=Dactylosporangium sp. CA-139066 TaxID=3239930 RepID=UPI003D92F9BB
MSEMPARRGWRGEAAGIPPVRTPAPPTVQPEPPATEPAAAPFAASAAPAPAVTETTRRALAPAVVPRPPALPGAEPGPRRPRPGRSARERSAGEHSAAERSVPERRHLAAREQFPLWPTTSTVALHEAPDPVETPGAVPEPQPEPPLDDTARQAGRNAVLEHLAGQPEQFAWTERSAPAERTEQWPPPSMRVLREARDERRSAPARPQRRPRRTRPPRGPLAGLSAMLLLGLLAGFFAWTSAEPFWLDMGHRVRGTAEITACQGDGVLRRCLADFAAPGREPVDGARVLGLDGGPGASVAAEMVPGGRTVYAGNESGLRVRWAAGLGLIALCGILLAWLTGAWRFGRFRDRLIAWTLTALAPLVLGAAIVAAAY